MHDRWSEGTVGAVFRQGYQTKRGIGTRRHCGGLNFLTSREIVSQILSSTRWTRSPKEVSDHSPGESPYAG